MSDDYCKHCGCYYPTHDEGCIAAGASEGQADTYDVRVAFEEIARAISEHEPLDRRVAVSMRALNRWHQALANFLYATPTGAARLEPEMTEFDIGKRAAFYMVIEKLDSMQGTDKEIVEKVWELKRELEDAIAKEPK